MTRHAAVVNYYHMENGFLSTAAEVLFVAYCDRRNEWVLFMRKWQFYCNERFAIDRQPVVPKYLL